MTHSTYRHEALVYRTLDEFVDVLVPFVRTGLEAGQPVMAALTGSRLEALRAGLGGRASKVRFVDMAELGRNPARIIAAWLTFVEEHPGRPVRGIGEPIWPTRTDTEVQESQLHEALLNLAVRPDIPLWLICPYDASQLSAEVVAEAHRSHPVLVDAEQYRGSTSYGGAYHAEQLFATPLCEPDGIAEAMTVTVADVGFLQERIAAAVERAGAAEERATELGWTVRQLATDSIRSGGSATVRYWTAGSSFVVEVCDLGSISDPLIGRRPAADQEPRRRSIHHANRTSDLVQVRSTSRGTVVRVHVWVHSTN